MKYLWFFLSVSGLSFVFGCSNYDIKYYDMVGYESEKREHPARFIYGNADNILKSNEPISLPHLSEQDSRIRATKMMEPIWSQIGSRDYVLIGEILGGGSARVSYDQLLEKMQKKAAKKGGDLLFIYDHGVNSVPYAYWTPGYSNTNSSGYSQGQAQVWGNNNYAYGQGQVNSQYNSTTVTTPPQYHSGTYYFPYCRALVFQYRQDFSKYNDLQNKIPADKYQQVGDCCRQNINVSTYNDKIRILENCLKQFEN